MSISRDNLFQHSCANIWINTECMNCSKFIKMEFPYTDDEVELTDHFKDELEAQGWDEDEDHCIICNDCVTNKV
jgi:hypothetical protein